MPDPAEAIGVAEEAVIPEPSGRPMLQLDRILAPTDFSKHSEAAVRTACELAERLGAELHLLHVLSDVVVPAGPDPMLISSMPPEYYQEIESQARQTLDSLCQP